MPKEACLHMSLHNWGRRSERNHLLVVVSRRVPNGMLTRPKGGTTYIYPIHLSSQSCQRSLRRSLRTHMVSSKVEPSSRGGCEQTYMYPSVYSSVAYNRDRNSRAVPC